MRKQSGVDAYLSGRPERLLRAAGTAEAGRDGRVWVAAGAALASLPISVSIPIAAQSLSDDPFTLTLAFALVLINTCGSLRHDVVECRVCWKEAAQSYCRLQVEFVKRRSEILVGK